MYALQEVVAEPGIMVRHQVNNIDTGYVREVPRLLLTIFAHRHIFRYHAVLLRDRFDKNRTVPIGQAKELVVAGEKELFSKQHYQPKKCTVG